MTKERKIAIEMWEAMREKICNGEIEDALHMQLAKQEWLDAHGIDWYCECWFCHYFRKEIEDDNEFYYADEDEDEEEQKAGKTSKCPLNHYRPHRCEGNCRQYIRACEKKHPLGQRLAAVDNIIKALKGEYKA